MTWLEWYDRLQHAAPLPECSLPALTQDEAVEVGIQLLQQRRRQLGLVVRDHADDRLRITEQLQLATQPWLQSLQFLTDHPELAAILDELWMQSLPIAIKGSDVSPVHHVAFVVWFMTRIGLAELNRQDLKRGVLAALLHDIGIGDCNLPKISEEMLQKAGPLDRERLRRDGIKSRLEHMQKGAVIARHLLCNYQTFHSDSLSNEDIDVIVDIVETHDNSKILFLEGVANRKWLLRPPPSDWLKQCHWEADALWMLSPAGILVDLDRQKETDTFDNRRAKFQFNQKLHAEVVTFYREVYSPEEFQRFGFRDGLLYRTQTGYDLCQEFMKLVN